MYIQVKEKSLLEPWLICAQSYYQVKDIDEDSTSYSPNLSISINKNKPLSFHEGGKGGKETKNYVYLFSQTYMN